MTRAKNEIRSAGPRRVVRFRIEARTYLVYDGEFGREAQLKPIVIDELRIEERAESPDKVELWFCGRSNARQPIDLLGPFFGQWLDRVAQANQTLVLRFEELEYMNSSTISALIHLIQGAKSRTVRLELVYAPAKKWQKLSFDALRVFQKQDENLLLTPSDGVTS